MNDDVQNVPDDTQAPAETPTTLTSASISPATPVAETDLNVTESASNGISAEPGPATESVTSEASGA